MKVVIGNDLVEGAEAGTEAEKEIGTITSRPIDPAAGGADLAPKTATDLGETPAGDQSQGKHRRKGKKKRKNSSCRDCLKPGSLPVR
jgi:hypothetical protein